MTTKLRVSPTPLTIPIVAAGNFGAPGEQGPPGPQGPQGPPGPPGADSTVPGPAGPAGPQGAQGEKGDQGLTGAVGPAGATGNTGPMGPQGPQGVPGADSTVPGPQGPQGPAGPPGADSTVPGPTGPEGPAGETGPPGPAGADSTVPGPQGPKGDTGATGPAGADSTVPGPTGPEGPAGAMGPQGPPGADSTVPGPQGPAGATGAQGPAGATGAPGPNLVDGSTPTPLTGLLRGNGTDIDVATAGTHYYAPGTAIADSDIPSAITRDSEMTAADALKVDKDSVVIAATRLVATKLLAGDAQPAFRTLGDGKHEWGPGGATVPDTNLYRSAGGVLKTDGALKTGNHVYMGEGRAGLITANVDTATFYFGSAGDTNLYRSAADTLKTDDHLIVAQNVQVAGLYGAGGAGLSVVANGDTTYRILLFNDGKIWWAPGNAGADTNLYRASVAVLKTDGEMQASSFVRGGAGTAGLVTLGNSSGQATIYFGNALDTILYRGAAGVLRTDGALSATKLAAREGAALTVTSNTVTVTNGYHRVVTNAGNADLTTISGGADGDRLILTNATGASFNIGSATVGNVRPAAVPMGNFVSKLLVYNNTIGIWLLIS